MTNPERLKALLLNALAIKGPRTSVPRYAVHKILYYLKMRAPEAFSADLPFYWYKHGPYSDLVDQAIAELQTSGALGISELETGGHLIHLQATQVPRLTVGDASLLTNTLHPLNYSESSLILDDIYRDHAPYLFMPLFKRDVLTYMESLAEIVAADSGSLPRLAVRAVNQLKEIMPQTEAALPLEPLFAEFNDAYGTYVTAVNRLLSGISDLSGPDRIRAVELTRKASSEVWHTFAYGVRIGHHDPYYDSMVQRWNKDYASMLRMLNGEVTQYYFSLSELVGDRLLERMASSADLQIISGITPETLWLGDE